MLPARKDCALLFLHSLIKRALALLTCTCQSPQCVHSNAVGKEDPQITGEGRRGSQEPASVLGQATPLLGGGSLAAVLFVLCGFSLRGQYFRIKLSKEDWVAVFFEMLSIIACWRFLTSCYDSAGSSYRVLPTFPPSPPRGRGNSKALPFLSW